MNSSLIRVLAAACLLPLYACSTASNTGMFEPVTAKDDMATVYIYRPTVMANSFYSPELYVDGEIKLNLKTGNKYPLTLSPGETIFEIEPDKKYTGTTRLKLTLQANKLYYLRVDTSLKIKNALTYEKYQRSFSLIRIESEEAITEIAECCSQKTTKNIDKTESELKTDKHNSSKSFSIDKTQNPFSH